MRHNKREHVDILKDAKISHKVLGLVVHAKNNKLQGLKRAEHVDMGCRTS